MTRYRNDCASCHAMCSFLLHPEGICPRCRFACKARNPYGDCVEEFECVDLRLLDDVWAIFCKALTVTLIAVFAVPTLLVFVEVFWFDIIRLLSL